HPHPDQAGDLIERREQVTLRLRGHTFAPWNPLQSAVEVVALHHSRSCGVPIETALTHVWTAHAAGTAERPVWQAVAAGQVTARQARTILAQSRHLAARTATLTADTDGEISEGEIVEGPALLEGEALTQALDTFHTTALTWAREGKVGSALHGRCFRLLERMTPPTTNASSGTPATPAAKRS
ncbi:hypothetical protein, partial [Terrabacter sp. NPDC000476]|uniref:hypothetical protein n=1 Tax=Terrabacter sp. NPDC000476 TaxID=3154258 RepID=UPI00332DFED6